jgi:hypothetical protein
MAKREKRLKPIEHERRQLDNLKLLEPSSTPARYRALSGTMVYIAVAGLDILRALETGNKDALDFERFHDLVDSLEDTFGAGEVLTRHVDLGSGPCPTGDDKTPALGMCLERLKMNATFYQINDGFLN